MTNPNLTLREHASALKLLRKITMMNPTECNKVINDPESSHLIQLLKMLGQEEHKHKERAIMAKIKQAALEIKTQQRT